MSNLIILPNKIVNGVVTGLPASKSVSNRVMIMDALTGFQSVIQNHSEARDTQLMNMLVKSSNQEIDVMDAGTTMRFLTAYYAISGTNRIMTGTDRMKERPIYPLVDALRTIGADIRYLGKEGFPPLEILGFSGQRSEYVSVPGNLSSQYISALMMIGPALPKGLIIELTGTIGSKPYIQMTESIMNMFGARVHFEGNRIEIMTGGLHPVHYMVEPDWSAASYWFSFCGLASESKITLPGNFSESFQGDQVISEIALKIGVRSLRSETELLLEKTDHQSHIEWDFSNCPDLAQTVLPWCALKGISGEFTGLESLRIKETDRIYALQQELKKIGATLSELNSGSWSLKPSTSIPNSVDIATYHDHRMAMGFAPWATQVKVSFEDSTVIKKSYPRFWEDMGRIGFELIKN